jgi:hypothetical protein
MVAKTDKPLLTVATVIAMRDEIEGLRRELAVKERKLQAAVEFLPEGIDLAALKIRRTKPPARIIARKRPKQFKLKAESRRGGRKASLTPDTWKGAVLYVLNAAEKGLTHAKILEGIQSTPMAETAKQNRKGYYNAIMRLEANDKLILRRGSLVYSKSVAERLMKLGPLPEQDPSQPTKPRGAPSTRDHVKAVLIENAEGLDGPAIIEALGKREGVTKSVMTHKHFLYTLLGKMIEDNELTRTDGVYRLRGPIEVKSGPVARTTDPLH